MIWETTDNFWVWTPGDHHGPRKAATFDEALGFIREAFAAEPPEPFLFAIDEIYSTLHGTVVSGSIKSGDVEPGEKVCVKWPIPGVLWVEVVDVWRERRMDGSCGLVLSKKFSVESLKGADRIVKQCRSETDVGE